MFINWIIFVAPICILSLVASAIGKQSDMSIVLETLSWLMASFFTAAAMQVVFCYCGIYFAFLRQNPLKYYASLIEALVLAFTTSSSAATLPVSMDCVVKSGKVPAGVARFVLPLGATINMDGTALYECVAALFIAQAYGLALGFGEQFTVVVLALMTSIGVAGVPAASLVAITIILAAMGLPLEGIGLILAVDRLLDMCRTAVNVFSDSCGAVIIARSEGEQTKLT